MKLTKVALFLSMSAVALGQGRPGPAQGPPPGQGPGPGPGGMWWHNPDMVRRVGLTADQQRKMDDVFQQNRPRLIDLSATLEKEEVAMEGLMRGPQLDDAKILPEIDRIAQARAELEKADARLMLGIRHVLSPDQWDKLNSDRPGPPPQSNGPRPNGGAPGQPGPPPRRPPGPQPAPPPRE